MILDLSADKHINTHPKRKKQMFLPIYIVAATAITYYACFLALFLINHVILNTTHAPITKSRLLWTEGMEKNKAIARRKGTKAYQYWFVSFCLAIPMTLTAVFLPNDINTLQASAFVMLYLVPIYFLIVSHQAFRERCSSIAAIQQGMQDKLMNQSKVIAEHGTLIAVLQQELAAAATPSEIEDI